MKALLFGVLCVISFYTWADDSAEARCQQLESTDLNHEQLAQRGCCSHHGGVCGCAGQNLRCCDGVTSPSCGCHQVDPDKQLYLPPENMLPKS